MAIDLVFKIGNAIHGGLLKVSGGRIGWTAGKMPVVELTTTGRKSGKARTVLLTSPVQDGDTWALVASKAGNEHHPAWLLNLRDNPMVEMKTKGKTRAMTAREADATERAEIWPKVVAAYSGYAGYQEKTEREIPVVLLTPTE